MRSFQLTCSCFLWSNCIEGNRYFIFYLQNNRTMLIPKSQNEPLVYHKTLIYLLNFIDWFWFLMLLAHFLYKWNVFKKLETSLEASFFFFWGSWKEVFQGGFVEPFFPTRFLCFCKCSLYTVRNKRLFGENKIILLHHRVYSS